MFAYMEKISVQYRAIASNRDKGKYLASHTLLRNTYLYIERSFVSQFNMYCYLIIPIYINLSRFAAGRE